MPQSDMQMREQADEIQPATIGQSTLTWQQVRPLVEALRDIAQCSDDSVASDSAATALHKVFPGPDGLELLFNRVEP